MEKIELVFESIFGKKQLESQKEKRAKAFFFGFFLSNCLTLQNT
jgi:hypothetical protein